MHGAKMVWKQSNLGINAGGIPTGRAFMMATLDTISSTMGSSRMCFGSGFTLRCTSCLPPLPAENHAVRRLTRDQASDAVS